ncbi:hypothetical protein BGX34_006172 [Mortierella sp. NVP85]|nr:hypothetical protein BGX34_006172 [Mortierella sp. NVP85]
MTRLAPSLKSTLLLLSQISALLLSASLSSLAQAQPEYTHSANSAFEEGVAFYIHGGMPSYDHKDDVPLTQTFAIDLSVSWPANKPVFKQLPDGPSTSGPASTLSADRKTWFIVYAGTAYTFSFQSNKWEPVLPGTSFNDERIFAVTDPETGAIYIPYGTGSQTAATMLKVDLGSNSVDSVAMPATNLLRDYYVAWSAALHGLVMFGGVTTSLDDEPSTTMSIYSPQAGWSSATLGGDIPVPRQFGCFKPAYGGSKMVLFGGSRNFGRTLMSDIFILDVATNTWHQGPNATDDGAGREFPSCAVSGHFFIVWAGAKEWLQVVDSVMIYNMRTNQWISKYYPPDSETDYEVGNVPTPSTRSLVAIILGSVFAGLVVLSAIGAALLCWARNKPESHSVEERVGDPYNRSAKPDGRSSEPIDSKETLVIRTDDGPGRSNNPPALSGEPKSE